jgi:transcriptional regulator NrdR family protein
MNHVVKRAGHNEPYDIRKLYASIYAACISVRTPEGTAELVAEKVCAGIATWLGNKHEVTAADIRRTAAVELEVYNADAAYIYKHHRTIN